MHIHQHDANIVRYIDNTTPYIFRLCLPRLLAVVIILWTILEMNKNGKKAATRKTDKHHLLDANTKTCSISKCHGLKLVGKLKYRFQAHTHSKVSVIMMAKQPIITIMIWVNFHTNALTFSDILYYTDTFTCENDFWRTMIRWMYAARQHRIFRLFDETMPANYE